VSPDETPEVDPPAPVMLALVSFWFVLGVLAWLVSLVRKA